MNLDSSTSDTFSPVDCSPAKLLHDLQMRQIELEVQIEHLRNAKTKHEESDAYYADLFNNAPIGYLVLSDKGLISDVNIAACKLVGIDRRDLLSSSFASFVAPDDGDHWYLLFAQLIKHNQTLDIELALKNSQGKTLPVQLNCLSNNATVRISITNISNIRQTDTVWHDAQASVAIDSSYLLPLKTPEDLLCRLQKITSCVPGMVYKFRLRPDGSAHFPFASEGIRELFRLSPDDVRDDASQLFALIHPDDFEGVVASIQKAAQEVGSWRHEYRVKFDDGTVRWVFGSSLPEQEEDGSNLWYWYGFMSDITERKQIEESFKKSRHQLELLIKQAPINIAMFDLNMNHLAISDRWMMEFGGDFESLIGRNHYEVHPDLPAKWKLIHQQGLAGEFLKNDDDLWLQKDGSKLWLRWTVSPWFNDKGLIGGIIIFCENITRRKLLEENLHINTDLLNSIIDSTPLSIFSYDLQGRFTLVNKAVGEFYGKHKEDVLGKALHEVFPKDIADNKMTTNNQVLITGKPLNFEEQILTDFESLPRTLMVTKFPIQSASGEICGIGGVATDITEIRQAQGSMQAAALYARSLLEASLDPLVTISSEGKIDDVNKATERVTGLDRKQLIGSDFADYFTDAKKARDGYQLVFSNGFVTDYPLAIKHVSGKVTDVLYNASVYRDDKGCVLGVFAAARDITERKQIEQALRESEFLWKFAIEGAGDGVWDWNIQNDHAVYSRLWKEMLGYAEDEILPTNQEWLDRIHPDDQLHVAGVLQAYLDGKTEIYIVEYRLRCKDESYKWILARGLLVDYAEEGAPLRMIGTHTDISKRKHQEQQDKEHLNQLAHVTRLGLMGEMASGIAHEVNQPLTAIATYTQASLNMMKAESPNMDKLAEVVYKTQQQALRAGQIIRRMREFVKSNTKQVAATDLNELIQDAVSLCLPELKLGNIALTLQLQSPLPLINVDKIQIEQVIINLIRNSVDAFDSCLENQQKEISIDSLLTLNEGIEVRVKDNGPGIPDDQQQQILMPFYTTKTEGMGMGLSICCSIIEAHGGYLKFNSKVGKGTTFYFTLPIKKDTH